MGVATRKSRKKKGPDASRIVAMSCEGGGTSLMAARSKKASGPIEWTTWTKTSAITSRSCSSTHAEAARTMMKLRERKTRWFWSLYSSA